MKVALSGSIVTSGLSGTFRPPFADRSGRSPLDETSPFEPVQLGVGSLPRDTGKFGDLQDGPPFRAKSQKGLVTHTLVLLVEQLAIDGFKADVPHDSVSRRRPQIAHTSDVRFTSPTQI